MSKPSYSIEPLDINNYQLLVPLMKNCFGADVSPAYFKWKYFDNPAGNAVGFLAIEKNANEAVAFYGAMPQVFLVEGEKKTIYQACDTMTDTRHRKKSFFTVLANECYAKLKNEGSFFLIGIGGTAQSFPVLKYFGWKAIFNYANYFKPGPLCKLYFFSKYAPGHFTEESSPAVLEPLIIAGCPDAPVRSVKTLDHYKWRISNPNYNYKIISYKEAGDIKGFAVYYVHNNKILLFDFVFTNKHSKKGLLWYLSKIAAQQNYKGIVTFCQQGGYQSRILQKSLFISNPFKKGPLAEKPPFLVFSDEATMLKYADPGKWAVSAYDYDAI